MTTSTLRPVRVPLSAFGPAFGLSGLAGTWTAAAHSLGAPAAVGAALWLVATVTWVVTTARYLARPGGPRAILADLRHPAAGPFAALFAIVGLLLGGRLVASAPRAGEIVVWTMAVVAVVFAAWFLAVALQGGGALDAVHGGHLLPTVAAALISGQSLAVVGARHIAVGAWAVGILFWIIVGTVILARLAFRPPLPDALVPTLAILSAPPAVAGNAWFALNGGTVDVVEELLLGTFVVLMLVQVFLVPRYARLTFGLSFWALTFTAASSATFALRWLVLTEPAGYRVWSWVVVAGATGLIGWVAARSVVLVVPKLRPRAQRLRE
ncbi:C4-dicarboxylate transporter [Cellulomonas sp. WB94]|uniref:SLAC1 family transporter n=1 Tax=Cellulomonas sp. WB94 TaxID=2173174 RepID=UPI001304B473|nr:C4-dicarboxylate transporter [Cellulomonas sp. WB94]